MWERDKQPVQKLTMLKNMRRKACAACTKAKRPCSKRSPCCDRCERKNIPCRYPPINQTARDYAVTDGTIIAAEKSMTRAGEAYPIHVVYFEPFYSDLDGPQVGEAHHPCSIGMGRSTRPLPLGHDWFYSADSWTIARSGAPAFPSQAFETAALKHHIATVQSWMRQWTTTGRSPFIHHRLYALRMPRCLQDAYTTLTTYLARTPENSDLCFQIVQERATEIIEDAQRTAPTPSSGDAATDSIGGAVLLDPVDHLARVHALFVYQVIGLFDGDIGLRASAENRMSILTAWVAEMWESAELDASIYSTMLALDRATNDEQTGSVSRTEEETTAWRRWTVLESIRRAWLLVTITQSIYQLFKEGWSQCPGSVNWTTRAGLWDASDQYSWSKLVANGSGPLFVPSLRADILYKEATPSEVDEFGHAILIAQFGLEHTTKWKAQLS
ncbi:uncharacterized protein F4822DRAFT_393008 [Hypoxylon trugodes]|uniref:uncharacterized protein n=1 Tax=Hypoxylon trugodes TaxID=326681 RepID=UPI00218E505D|nr:uncharacterized protein F4822DRAFT_393008 [Hypoxylon trugodes]KAI1393067.1 hypothetical protein F4822DRAFT_393008 [Hypoxylon trugodes]